MRIHFGLAALLGSMTLIVASCHGTPHFAVSDSKHKVPLDFLPALSGEYFELPSRSVGRTFHIYVRLPQDDSGGSHAHPAVFVLDGDSLYPILAANHLFLHYDEGLPEAVIIGIAYGSLDPSINARGFDFSAPGPGASPEQGGAPAFHDFLKYELVPEIEARYRTDPARRVLFGQSRGGYMVLYSAFTDPDLFWGRIASNPAFDPGRERFFEPAAQASRSDLGLVVTSGSRDHPKLREAALSWFEAWEHIEDRPWSVRTTTIDGGTHAADSTRSYREGMLWLFARD